VDARRDGMVTVMVYVKCMSLTHSPAQTTLIKQVQFFVVFAFSSFLLLLQKFCAFGFCDRHFTTSLLTAAATHTHTHTHTHKSLVHTVTFTTTHLTLSHSISHSLTLTHTHSHSLHPTPTPASTHPHHQNKKTQ